MTVKRSTNIWSHPLQDLFIELIIVAVFGMIFYCKQIEYLNCYR